MPSDADQIRDLEAELDALDNPTTAEVLSHTQDYDAGIVAAIGVKRGTGAGGDVTWAAISSAIDGEDGDPQNVVLGDGTIGAVPNGGSQPNALIVRDLGVVNLVDLLAGPQTLYEPEAGEYVQIVIGPDGFVASDGLADIITAVTAVDQDPDFLWIAWPPGADFLSLVGTPKAGYVVGTTPIEATMSTTNNAYWVLSQPPAWQANHAYTSLFLILGPDDHIWSANEGGGTSGGSIPDFAGNHDGTVVDNTVTWTDEGAIPTVGSLHLYAVTGISA